jgi:hypothetical protein
MKIQLLLSTGCFIFIVSVIGLTINDAGTVEWSRMRYTYFTYNAFFAVFIPHWYSVLCIVEETEIS